MGKFKAILSILITVGFYYWTSFLLNIDPIMRDMWWYALTVMLTIFADMALTLTSIRLFATEFS